MSEPYARIRHVEVLRLDALAAAGDIDGLIAELDNPETDYHAASLLSTSNQPKAIAALLTRLESDPNAELRRIWAKALDYCKHPEVVPALFAALADEDPGVVEEACRALGTIKDPRAIEPLRTTLQHSDWLVVGTAVRALLSLGIADYTVTAAIDRLENAAPPGAHAYLKAFGTDITRWAERLWREQSEVAGAPTAAADLAFTLFRAQQELADVDPKVRAEGVYRLQGLPGQTVLALLLQAFNDPSPRVRSTAAGVLSSTKSDAALYAIIRHLREDPSRDVRRQCASALCWLPDPRTFEPLMEALRRGLDRGDEYLAGECAEALGALDDPRAVPQLLEVLDQQCWHARRTAAQALLRLKAADPRLVYALEQLASEPNAAQWDARSVDINYEQELVKGYASEMGEPEPQPRPTIQEMVEQARALLQAASAPGPDGANM